MGPAAVACVRTPTPPTGGDAQPEHGGPGPGPSRRDRPGAPRSTASRPTGAEPGSTGRAPRPHHGEPGSRGGSGSARRGRKRPSRRSADVMTASGSAGDLSPGPMGPPAPAGQRPSKTRHGGGRASIEGRPRSPRRAKPSPGGWSGGRGSEPCHRGRNRPRAFPGRVAPRVTRVLTRAEPEGRRRGSRPAHGGNVRSFRRTPMVRGGTWCGPDPSRRRCGLSPRGGPIGERCSGAARRHPATTMPTSVNTEDLSSDAPQGVAHRTRGTARRPAPAGGLRDRVQSSARAASSDGRP